MVKRKHVLRACLQIALSTCVIEVVIGLCKILETFPGYCVFAEVPVGVNSLLPRRQRRREMPHSHMSDLEVQSDSCSVCRRHNVWGFDTALLNIPCGWADTPCRLLFAVVSLLAASANLQQRLLASSYLSVRPSTWNNLASTGRILMKFYRRDFFFETLSRRF